MSLLLGIFSPYMASTLLASFPGLRGGKGGLVHTVCGCLLISQHFGISVLRTDNYCVYMSRPHTIQIMYLLAVYELAMDHNIQCAEKCIRIHCPASSLYLSVDLR